VRKGDVLCVVDSQDEVIKYMGRFIQYYRENAKFAERTYGFVERMGIEKIRSIVVEDSEGVGARLDEELQKAIMAYKDPWREAYTPATANQFESLLQVIQ
jgi:nitrite reductase (NADH) large subunit